VLADEIFGRPVKVYSEGRCGGWAIVDGLPDFESWDAVLLARWAKFARVARSLADNIPTQMVALLEINDWERECEENSAELRRQARRAFGLVL
jgi:hypothetical protein